MAYADWTHAITTVTGTYVTELVTSSDKIQGNSSLAYANSDGIANQPAGVSGWTAGVTSNNGLVQTMFRAVTTGGSAQLGGTVFCLMQSSISAASNCYFLCWKGGTLAMVRGNLVDYAQGLGSNVGLGTYATGGIDASDGQVYAIELKWQYDTGSGSMILIGGYDGPIASPNTYDFTTINKVINHTDSPALINGVTAGVGWAFAGSNPGGAGSVQMVYDVTQIYYP